MPEIICFNDFRSTQNNLKTITYPAGTIMPMLSDVELFKSSLSVSEVPYGITELNKWRLDGTYKVIDSGNVQKAPYWSAYVSSSTYSGEYGGYIFDKELNLTFDFSKNCSSDGITIRMGKDGYCTAMKITWKNNSSVVKEEIVKPDSYLYTKKINVNNFNRVTIAFLATNKPNRFVRIYDVKFVSSVILLDNFYNLSVLEEISISSDTLPMNTLTFDINVNEALLERLKQTYVIQLYHKNEAFGIFYLSDLEKITENRYTITCNDAVYILNNLEIRSKLFNISDTVSPAVTDIIDYIMSDTDIDYTVDKSIINSDVSMLIQAESKRSALSKILLVSNAVCLKKRNGCLWFGRLNTESYEKQIEQEQIFVNYGIRDNSIVTKCTMPYTSLTKINYGRYPAKSYYPKTLLDIRNHVLYEPVYQNGYITDYNFVTKNPVLITNVGDGYTELKVEWSDVGVFPDECDWYLSINWAAIDNTVSPVDVHIRNFENFKRNNSNAFPDITHKFEYSLAPNSLYIKLYLDTRKLRLSFALGSLYATAMDMNESNSSEYSENYYIVGNGTANEVKITDVYVSDITVNGETNNVAELLMKRYYQYNKVFESTILTNDIVCGDTVSIDIPGMGTVLGTVQKLEYRNLVNKKIADATIQLYI